MVLEEPKKDYLRVDLNVRTEMNMAETMSQCFQCGTCTATCVLNQHAEDGDPRMIPRLAFHQQVGVLDPIEHEARPLDAPNFAKGQV